MVICLERGADLHTAQLMPLPLTVSCFSKIQIAFAFLVPAYPGSSGQRAVKLMCVYVCLPCNLLLIARFSDTNVLEGFLSTYAASCGIFYTWGEMTSQNLCSRYVRHFVGIT